MVGHRSSVGGQQGPHHIKQVISFETVGRGGIESEKGKD